ncbi:MAG TPA: PAS domain S-box protein [Chloroflexota bacterium]|nr:PAS domain S-box protein [Chloroflexota bacterium]
MDRSAGQREMSPEFDPEVSHQLLESAPDGLVIVDQRGWIVYVNKQTETLFGYEPGQLLGQAVETLAPERRRATHAGYRDGFLANSAVRPMGAGRGLSGRRRDGTEFPVEISLSPVQTPDGVLAMGAIRDIVRTIAPEKPLQIDAQVDPSVRSVVTNASRLKQILYNYLSNAIKFTPDNGQVIVRAGSQDADWYRIEVEDTGIRIQTGERGRLFVGHQQRDSGTGKQYLGTGGGARVHQADGRGPGRRSRRHRHVRRRQRLLRDAPAGDATGRTSSSMSGDRSAGGRNAG